MQRVQRRPTIRKLFLFVATSKCTSISAPRALWYVLGQCWQIDAQIMTRSLLESMTDVYPMYALFAAQITLCSLPPADAELGFVLFASRPDSTDSTADMAPDNQGPVMTASPAAVRGNPPPPTPLVTPVNRLTPPVKACALADDTKCVLLQSQPAHPKQCSNSSLCIFAV